MNEADKRMIRARLTEALENLTSLHSEDAPLSLENFADDADYASQLTAHTMTLALKERDIEKIRRIEKALERIDSPDFGLCRECDAPIGKARLTARPDARLCVTCQHERESGLPACA
ncbi:TraR/DksA family transcriptional regulator [Desulfovibrio oxyclinae]|uniref:TraR/DksA family transcriptional regulator n=1 Tax=Desulfovibrio oxyclinae TaxID=63560 RepID=UPI00037E14F8|nr:TraR/DksA family transcriptional regulator [Desulfovibrio oxyclinae]